MWQTLFSWAPKFTAVSDCSHEIKRYLLLGRKAVTILDCVLKSRHHFADKILSGQSYDFSSSHVQVWELDHKESWVPKNWWFQTVVLEKTLETSLDSKESKSVSPKGNEPWIFIRGNDSEALMLWPPDVKGQLSGKDPDAGKDWRLEEKGVTENEMFGCIIDPVDMSLSKLQEIVRDRVRCTVAHEIAELDTT